VLLFSIEFFDYDATIVSKSSLHCIRGNIQNLLLRLDRSISTFKSSSNKTFKEVCVK